MGGCHKSTFVNLGGGKSWWGEIIEGEKVGGNLGGRKSWWGNSWWGKHWGGNHGEGNEQGLR